MIGNLLFLVVSIFVQSWALAQSWDPGTATRVSLASTQDMLAAPPLPSLETSGRPEVTVQASAIGGRNSGEVWGSTGIHNYDYVGAFNGNAYGLGISTPSYGRFGFFAFGLTNRLEGQMDTYQGRLLHDISIRDISTRGSAWAAGVSYRFIGEGGKTPFAVGAFLGPAAMKFDNEFDWCQSQGCNRYKTAPEFSGIYGGLQIKWRWQKFLAIPYVLHFRDTSDSCKKYDTKVIYRVSYCDDDPSRMYYMTMKGTFTGYGLILGYGDLKFNVYSKATRDEDTSNVKTSSYSLSYGFEL